MPEPRRVLIIDDEDSLREIFRRFMEKEGFIVEEAEDGSKGLAKIEDFNPDIVFLDLMMPQLSGFEVIHRLQGKGLVKIPVVIITGYSDEANEQIIRAEPNVVELLKKPIRFGELVDLIDRLLKKNIP